MITKLTKENFNQEVFNSQLPVLVDFSAEWCGSCKMMHLVLEEVSKELSGKIKIYEVNIDENLELAIEYEIRRIPNMKLFKNGQVINTFDEFIPKKIFLDELKKSLNG
ncbi:glutaredoxin family protein [Patescibacteria group bacterium]|nr:glutaredoxin family protein [Patescibacteria group bacterium]HQL11741.1 thioredoxin domain-containing protein [bacterium]